MIKGIDVVLYNQKEVSRDPLNRPIYEEEAITIRNVLVSPSTPEDVITSTDLVGKKAVYTLAIPKGDTNTWEDKKVFFMGKFWHVFGFTIEGIEENIPLKWNKKVMVERYE